MCRCGIARDGYFHRQVDKIVEPAFVGAGEREGLRGIPRDCNADQVPPASEIVGRIELDPAGAGKVDLDPRVSRTGADRANFEAFNCRVVDVSADKTGRETEAAHGLHHEKGVVAATPGTCRKSLLRGLSPLRLRVLVGKGGLDCAIAIEL